MSRVPRNLKLMWLLQKPTYQFLTAWWSEVVTWKETGLQVPDSMIVGDVSLTENYAVVATSERPIPDCMIVRSLFFKRKSNVHFLTAWLPETWTWMKTEHQIPDRMLVRNLVLAWNWSSISWLDIHEKLRGLLNTSWQLSLIQHAWNHCESWDVWYVKRIIGPCCPDSNSRPMQSRLMSLDSDPKFQNNSASRQNRTLPTVHSGQCIVIQQDHSVLWPRPPRPLGSVWWGHSTKPASQG